MNNANRLKTNKLTIFIYSVENQFVYIYINDVICDSLLYLKIYDKRKRKYRYVGVWNEMELR